MATAISIKDFKDQSTSCGELACQKDSMLRVLATRVLACSKRVEIPEKTSSGGKGGRNGKGKGKEIKALEPKKTRDLFDVLLEDTVLFPEGGGQPSDRGTINGLRCIRVENIGGQAIHIIESESSQGSTPPLEAGEDVRVELNWSRRWDHATQHSAQHLLTALATHKWGIETVSWGLGALAEDNSSGAGRSFLELNTPEVSEAMVAELEDMANEAVQAATPVVPSWHDAADLKAGQVPGLRVSSKALPDSVTGPVRVVAFQGIDTNTCCGTHVPTTAHLQAIKLLKVEKQGRGGSGGGGGKGGGTKVGGGEQKSGNVVSGDATSSSKGSAGEGRTGTVKLWYAAGPRVLALLGDSYSREAALGVRLSVGPEQLVARVDDLLLRERAANRAVKALTREVVELTAASLLAEVAQRRRRFGGGGLVDVESSLRAPEGLLSGGAPAEGRAEAQEEEGGGHLPSVEVLSSHRVLGSDAAEYMKGLATAVCDSSSLPKGLSVVLVVTVAPAAESGGGSSGTDGMFLVASANAELVAAAAPAVARVLDGRGGGRGGRYQGKCKSLSPEKRSEALEAARKALLQSQLG